MPDFPSTILDAPRCITIGKKGGVNYKKQHVLSFTQFSGIIPKNLNRTHLEKTFRVSNISQNALRSNYAIANANCVDCGTKLKIKRDVTSVISCKQCKNVYTKSLIRIKQKTTLTKLQKSILKTTTPLIVTFDQKEMDKIKEKYTSNCLKRKKPSPKIYNTAPCEINIPPPVFYPGHVGRLVVRRLEEVALGIRDSRTKKPLSIGDLQIFFGSIRQKLSHGKNNLIRRFVISHRPSNIGRAVCGTSSTLEPDEVILPDIMWKNLNCPQYVLLIRFPSLGALNLRVQRVKCTTKASCILVPQNILPGMAGDLDGDLVSVQAIDASVQEEVVMCMSARYTPTAVGQLKMSLSSDAKFGLGPSWERALEDIYLEYVVTGNAEKCYGSFKALERAGHERALDSPGLELESLFNFSEKVGSKSTYGAFENAAKSENSLLFQFARANATRFDMKHLYQIFSRVGLQRYGIIGTPKNVESNFLFGLDQVGFVDHVRAARQMIVESSGNAIAQSGQSCYRLGFCLPDMLVSNGEVLDSRGRLVSRSVFDLHPRNVSVTKELAEKIRQLARRDPLRK